MASLTMFTLNQGYGSSRIFLLPLPAPYKVSRFLVCFHFQLLSSECFRSHKNLTASRFRFHIHASCFMKNASASGSSKSQMLPSLLPTSFFKVLPLPQKFNRFHRFRFQLSLPLPHSCSKSKFV